MGICLVFTPASVVAALYYGGCDSVARTHVKAVVVTAPCLLLLLDYWPLVRKERLTVLLREKLPFFALAAAVSATTFVAQKQGGAMMHIENLTLPERLANAAVSYVLYLGKISGPHPLAVLYPYQRDLSAFFVIVCLLLLSAITASVLLLGGSRRYLPVGWFWFLGTMVPMIGIVQVGWQGYADRYTYIPSIGIFIAIVWMTADAAESLQWQRGTLAVATAILAGLALTTWSQLPYWHDDITLFEHAVASTSANPAAQYHLAGDFMDQNRYTEAIPHLEEMISCDRIFMRRIIFWAKPRLRKATPNPHPGVFPRPCGLDRIMPRLTTREVRCSLKRETARPRSRTSGRH